MLYLSCLNHHFLFNNTCCKRLIYSVSCSFGKCMKFRNLKIKFDNKINRHTQYCIHTQNSDNDNCNHIAVMPLKQRLNNILKVTVIKQIGVLHSVNLMKLWERTLAASVAQVTPMCPHQCVKSWWAIKRQQQSHHPSVVLQSKPHQILYYEAVTKLFIGLHGYDSWQLHCVLR